MAPSKAKLIRDSQDFVDDMMEFTSRSLEWCAQESEKAAQTVGETITFLLSDAKRISIMSTEAVSLLEQVRGKDKAAVDAAPKAGVLIDSLKKLCTEEADFHRFVDPVVEALQFQDRISQMMENMIRMIATWASMRSNLEGQPTLAEADLLEFGHTLLGCTTMAEERRFIRQAIPGLPEEQGITEAQLF